MRDLGAERGGKPRTERALITRGDKGARLVDRKPIPGGEADLRQLIGDDGIVRQHLAQDIQVRHLRLHLLNFPQRRRRSLADRGAAAARLAVAGFSDGCEQLARADFRIRDDGGIGCVAAHLGRIDIDTDRFQAVWLKRPSERRGRQFHARSDPDHQVDLRP